MVPCIVVLSLSLVAPQLFCVISESQSMDIKFLGILGQFTASSLVTATCLTQGINTSMISLAKHFPRKMLVSETCKLRLA